MPTLYVNRFPELLEQELEAARRAGVAPINVPSQAFSKLAAARVRMIYAILSDRRLVVAPRQWLDEDIKHSVLAREDPVLAAGEFSVASQENEIVVSGLDNWSGHYQPRASCVELAKEAFEAAGISVSPNAVSANPWRTS